MKLLGKIATAFRGSASEVGEAIVDNQALRILDQEMRDATRELGQAKENAATVLAQKHGLGREIRKLEEQIGEYTSHAEAALAKGDDGLAGDVCERIAALEQDKELKAGMLEQVATSADKIRNDIAGAERNIAAMKNQIQIVKATEKTQKASAMVARRHSGTSSAMSSASESLARIKARQQEQADRMAAAAEIDDAASGADLDAQLAKAGITATRSAGSDVLARLKAKQAA